MSNKFFLLIAFVIFSLVSLLNLGYYHADEHFQIIEFAGLKLGFNEEYQLTWEYHERLRPTIQPLLAYVVISICNFFELVNPFYIIIVLKFISSLLAIFIINYFINNSFFDERKKSILRLLYLCVWFIPLISSRFSSETWGGLFCLLSLSYYYTIRETNSYSNTKYFVLGLIMGLSFVFRFQMAFFFIGFAIWLYFIEKLNILFFLLISIGCIFSLILGVIIDYWFYGELVFSPWNYFYSNIIESKASSFGEEPFFYYFSKVYDLPVFGYVFTILIPFILIKYPKSIYLIGPLFYLLGHSIVNHKEFRFIFPLCYFVPVYLMFLIEYLSNYGFKKIKILLYSCFIFANFLVYSLVLLKSEDDNGRYRIAKYLYDNYKSEEINLISLPYSSPYNPFGALANFYITTNITEIKCDNLCEVKPINNGKRTFLLFRKVYSELNESCRLDSTNFKFVKQSTSPIVEKVITNYYDKGFSDYVLMLYEIK